MQTHCQTPCETSKRAIVQRCMHIHAPMFRTCSMHRSFSSISDRSSFSMLDMVLVSVALAFIRSCVCSTCKPIR